MRIADSSPRAPLRAKRLTIIGGGNIGSSAVGLLGKLPMVSELQLVDGDVFSESNLSSQAIGVDDVGQPKATCLARRMAPLCPGVTFRAIPRWVEDVPLGWLRSDVIVACVDSRRARCVINEVACRLGVPWIDSAVDAADLLARVMVYLPGPGRPCFLCNFTSADYAAMAQNYPCAKAPAAVAPTNAPASLGCIAAGQVATQCQLLLSGALHEEAYGCQVLWDCRHHRCLTTSYRVNPKCRFDHQTWALEPWPQFRPSMTVGQFVESLRTSLAGVPQAIQVAGQSFTLRLVCPSCGAHRDPCLYLLRALSAKRLLCRRCGGVPVAPGFDTVDYLSPDMLCRRQLQKSLSSVGLLEGDVVVVRADGVDRYLELVRQRAGCHAEATVCAASAAEP